MMDGSQFTIGEEWLPIECFRCGLCCILYRPKVRPEDIKVIARELRLPREEFMTKYVQSSHLEDVKLIQNEEDKCPFLIFEKSFASCTIHSVRPLACRNWQASLSRHECREGLTRLSKVKGILSLDQLYSSEIDITKLIRATSTKS